MELIEKIAEGLSEVWRAVNDTPMPFSLIGIAIFLFGYAIAYWYYRREVRVLRHWVLYWNSASRATSKKTRGSPHCCNRKRDKHSPQSFGHRATRSMCLIPPRKSLPDLNTSSCWTWE